MMKATLRNLALLALSLSALAACRSTDPAAKLLIAQNVSEKIENSNYIFHASVANPMGGKTIFLTSDYTLKVTADTISAHLPYYGRAYTAGNPTDGGIKFISTDFDYQVSEKKKGITRVAIKIKDNQSSYKLSLLIGETGNSTLYVDQNNKQGITFTGDIH